MKCHALSWTCLQVLQVHEDMLGGYNQKQIRREIKEISQMAAYTAGGIDDIGRELASTQDLQSDTQTLALFRALAELASTSPSPHPQELTVNLVYYSI